MSLLFESLLHRFGPNVRDDGLDLFAGPTFDYLFLSYTDEAGEKSELSRPGVGLRTGYRFDLFSESETFGGLYVTPWVSASYIFDHEEVTIAGENYEVGSVKVFPTLHVGWRF